jgi:LysM repeat protein
MRVQSVDILAAQTRVRRRFEDALRAPIPKRNRGIRQFVYAIAAVVIIAFIAVGSLATASQSSIPGDPLYGAKLFSEGLQRSLFDNDGLEANFNQSRIQEIQQLLALGRSEDVSFKGIITAQNGTNWVIATLPITVPFDMPNTATIHIGDKVDVTAHTSELHALTATTIQITEPASTPLPTIAIPTQTPSPIGTTTPSPTSSLIATQPILTMTSLPTIQTPIATLPTILQATTAAPTPCLPTQPNGWVSYQIRSGDTLSALASGQSISLAELMTTNCISDASHIVVGETIYLPIAPTISATAANNSNQDSGSNNSGSNNSSSPNPTDDHGGSNSGHGGSGNGGSGGSDDGSGHK